AEDEQVRKPAGVEPVEGRHALGPFLRQRLAVSAGGFTTRPPRVARADLEARGIDDAVDLVLDAARDDTVLGDALDAATVRVDQRDVVAIERVEVLVVEAG